MSDTTTPNLRTLAERPAPVAALPTPWQEAQIAGDPVRAAAHELAERSGSVFAALTAAKAADMLSRALPGAAQAIIERDYAATCTCHTMRLRLVRDDAGAVLWRCTAFAEHPDVVRRDELEAYGGPVLPVLDEDTREAIESLAAAAQRWGSPLASADETFTELHGGVREPVVYDGELYVLLVDEALAFAAAPPTGSASPAIALVRLATVLAGETGVIVAEDAASRPGVVHTEASAAAADRRR
ncbi:hypothetical protein ACFFX1_49325 [Dactylosporangium sucinum]|uniref:Uncharacterized protein n=1 Tax=Dactylosporangium sucinum TaxID=1424081 RepID=A0A917UG77_9ACTN|nr:hypothetical protein [Dactylosporangium sucinum]GGM90033.1 hypothetical protein GCM10007977_110110 [Dactylosporangium sucinum]